MSGKGSSARPFSVSREEYRRRWEAIDWGRGTRGRSISGTEAARQINDACDSLMEKVHGESR